MEKVDILVVDKTGTLTEGKPELTEVVVQPNWEKSELLALVASLERSSEHPLASAIVVIPKTHKRIMVSTLLASPDQYYLVIRRVFGERTISMGSFTASTETSPRGYRGLVRWRGSC